jgi:hypothetical protein
MQLGVFLHIVHLYQFDESRKGCLGVHHLEDGIIFAVASIVQQKRCDYVKSRIVLFLQPNQLCHMADYPRRVPGEDSILFVAAHSLGGRYRGHLPVGGRCILPSNSRFGGIRLLVVNIHQRRTLGWRRVHL